jgi:hypothetical protein
MEKVITWVKNNPLLAGGAAIGALLLFALLGRSNQTQVVSSGPSEAIQAASIQADSQLQSAKIAASSQSDLLSAQLAAMRDQNQLEATVSLAGIQASLEASRSQSNAQIASSFLGAATTIATNPIYNETFSQKGGLFGSKSGGSKTVVDQTSTINNLSQIASQFLSGSSNSANTGTQSASNNLGSYTVPNAQVPVNKAPRTGLPITRDGFTQRFDNATIASE